MEKPVVKPQLVYKIRTRPGMSWKITLVLEMSWNSKVSWKITTVLEKYPGKWVNRIKL